MFGGDKGLITKSIIFWTFELKLLLFLLAYMNMNGNLKEEDVLHKDKELKGCKNYPCFQFL